MFDGARCMGCAYQTLEGELSDEKLGRLLVSSNLTESDGTGLVAVRLLDTSSRWGALAGCEVVSVGAVMARRRDRRRDARIGRTHQPWKPAAFGGPCHQWTCGRSA